MSDTKIHLTVRSHDLHNLLKTAILFACKDSTIPGINGVRLERHGDQLLAIATDRFRLGITRITLTGNQCEGDFAAYVRLDQIKPAIPTLKVPVRDQDWQLVTLSIEPGNTGDRVVRWHR